MPRIMFDKIQVPEVQASWYKWLNNYTQTLKCTGIALWKHVVFLFLFPMMVKTEDHGGLVDATWASLGA